MDNLGTLDRQRWGKQPRRRYVRRPEPAYDGPENMIASFFETYCQCLFIFLTNSPAEYVSNSSCLAPFEGARPGFEDVPGLVFMI